jgi:hypothetical protein
MKRIPACFLPLVGCGAPAPTVLSGAQLVRGQLLLGGLTSDGQVALLDEARGALAVPLDGGAPFNDHDQPVPKRPSGRADLYVVDRASAAAPTRIATRADARFFLSPAKDRIAYVLSEDHTDADLWVAPLP